MRARVRVRDAWVRVDPYLYPYPYPYPHPYPYPGARRGLAPCYG